MLKQNEWAALLRQAHAAKVAGDKYKALSEEIKSHMMEDGLDTVPAGGYTATVKTVETPTIDWKRFQADHPELADEIAKYKVVKPTTRLYLK